MRLALLADVHGNLPALEAVLEDARALAARFPGVRGARVIGREETVVEFRAFRDLVVPFRGYGAYTGTLPLVPISDGVGEIVETGAGGGIGAADDAYRADGARVALVARRRDALSGIVGEINAGSDGNPAFLRVHDVRHTVEVPELLQDIAREFLRWDSGFFNFKAVETGEEDLERVFHDDEAKLTEFINVDPFILDLLAKVDAVGGDGTVRPVPRPDRDSPFEDTSIKSIYDLLNYIVEPGHSVFRSDPADVITEWPSDLAELRKLMAEIQVRPAVTMGEVALLILRYATRVVNRGRLFGVTAEGISGIGQFGIGRGDDQAPVVDRRVRQIHIPGDEPSVFSNVIETMSTYHGHLEKCPWNNYLVDQLGEDRRGAHAGTARDTPHGGPRPALCGHACRELGQFSRLSRASVADTLHPRAS